MEKERITLIWNDIKYELPDDEKEYFVQYTEEFKGVKLLSMTVAKFTRNQHDGAYFESLEGRMGYGDDECCLKVIAWAEKPNTIPC